jgi:hypothetical protein
MSREQVLRVAVAFADERGVGPLTMRKLGEAALGVEAMSLYKPRGQQGRAPRRHGRSV